MNIFFVAESPDEAARCLCDKHIGKMILESAQMLSTAVTLLLPSSDTSRYKLTHRNHPSAVWLRQSPANVEWLIAHCRAMDNERLRSGSKASHKSLAVAEACAAALLQSPGSWATSAAMTPVALCVADAPASHAQLSEAVPVYRHYYKSHKAAIATWKTPRTAPTWWN